MSEVLGTKTVLLSATMFRNGTSFQQIPFSVEKELGAQPARTLRHHTEFHQGQVPNLSSKQ